MASFPVITFFIAHLFPLCIGTRFEGTPNCLFKATLRSISQGGILFSAPRWSSQISWRFSDRHCNSPMPLDSFPVFHNSAQDSSAHLLAEMSHPWPRSADMHRSPWHTLSSPRRHTQDL